MGVNGGVSRVMSQILQSFDYLFYYAFFIFDIVELLLCNSRELEEELHLDTLGWGGLATQGHPNQLCEDHLSWQILVQTLP